MDIWYFALLCYKPSITLIAVVILVGRVVILIGRLTSTTSPNPPRCLHMVYHPRRTTPPTKHAPVIQM
jgi:hypothetical protein